MKLSGEAVIDGRPVSFTIERRDGCAVLLLEVAYPSVTAALEAVKAVDESDARKAAPAGLDPVVEADELDAYVAGTVSVNPPPPLPGAVLASHDVFAWVDGDGEITFHGIRPDRKKSRSIAPASALKKGHPWAVTRDS